MEDETKNSNSSNETTTTTGQQQGDNTIQGETQTEMNPSSSHSGSSSSSVSSKQDEGEMGHPPSTPTTNNDDNKDSEDSDDSIAKQLLNQIQVERRSKRRRTSAFAKRFTPGEGGGLAQRKDHKRFRSEQQEDSSFGVVVGKGMAEKEGEKAATTAAADADADADAAMSDDDQEINEEQDEQADDAARTTSSKQPKKLVASRNDTNVTVKIKCEGGSHGSSSSLGEGSVKTKRKPSNAALTASLLGGGKAKLLEGKKKSKQQLAVVVASSGVEAPKSSAHQQQQHDGNEETNGIEERGTSSNNSTITTKKGPGQPSRTTSSSRKEKNAPIWGVAAKDGNTKKSQKPSKGDGMKQSSQSSSSYLNKPKKSYKQGESDPSIATGSNEWPGPSYRWIDEGGNTNMDVDDDFFPPPPPKLVASSSLSSTQLAKPFATPIIATNPECIVVEHQGLEIDFGGVNNNKNSNMTNKTSGKQKQSSSSLLSSSQAQQQQQFVSNNNDTSTTIPSNDTWIPPPPFVVRPGDVVLLSSGDVPWNDLNHLVVRAQAMIQAVTGSSGSLDMEEGEGSGGGGEGGGGVAEKKAALQSSNEEPVAQSSWQQKQQHNSGLDVVPIYNDPASREPGFGALDPFIARIERMWEEVEDPAALTDTSKKAPGKAKKKGKDAKPVKTELDTPTKQLLARKESRMMIRCRWFFKREDMESLNGKFVIEGQQKNKGDAKASIISAMKLRDLILTELSDDNPVYTILGKAQLVRRKPLEEGNVDAGTSVPRGAFVCRYDVKIRPAKSSGKEGAVVLIPCQDELDLDAKSEVDEYNEVVEKHPKRAKLENEVEPTENNELEEKRNSINDGLARESSNPILFDTSSDDDKERHEDSSAHFGSSPMRTVISEGATTIGKIQVGLNFQAVVPPAQDLDKKNSSQRNPMMVWNPIFCNDRRVDDYIDEACSILSEYLQQLGIEPYHEVNYLESPDPKTESKRSREFSVDCLMAELHENKYNTRAALKKVSENPTKFMTVWSNQEKAQFDSSYRTYKEALRMISKNIGDTKSCKDVVDYHYRFSIPEKFRRYKTKKRQHAHRMMEIAEDRVLNEKLMQEARKADNSDSDNSNSDEEEENPHAIMNGVSSSTLSGSSSSRVGAVNSRIRSWVRSGGGGDDVVGATQNRRNQACELLSQVQEEVGADAYIALAKRLKAFNSQSATSLSDVKIAAEDIMKLHPHLLARFMAFLPKEIRSM